MARRYARDNRGRFSSTGATARGGRLATASGKKRATQTKAIAAVKPAGTVDKPKGLKPGAISGKTKPAVAQSRAQQLRQRAAGLEQRGNALMGGGRQDRAAVNVSLNSRARSNETNAGFRGLEMSRTAAGLRGKADRIEQRAAQSSAKALREAAKPKRTRSVESLRASRAKQIEKRRSITTNPAGERPAAAAKMAANAARTQQRATAFLKAGGKPSPSAVAQGAIKSKVAATTPKQSSRRRRPTAEQSRAAGLTPISDIRARQAAQNAARDASRTRRVQSNMSRARGQQVASTQGKQRAPFGRYSTIKNPAAEGSFPQMAPGRTGLGMSQAAKGRASTASRRTKTNTQYGQQANRAISKAYAQSAARMAKADGLEQKLRVQQRTQRRLNRIAALAEKRGLVRTVTGIEGFDNPNYRFRGRSRK